MRIAYSSKKHKGVADRSVSSAFEKVSQESLRRAVSALSRPRNFQAESVNNERCAKWIADELESFGYRTHLQGRYRNVVALPRTPDMETSNAVLVGAHYDSVPGTPGADDNASGVAALLECARVLASVKSPAPIAFVAFNGEEDGLIGSTDFVQNYLPSSSLRIAAVHVLEMLGYCSHEPGSQRIPRGLPIRVPSVGDFIGVLGNRNSNRLVDSIMQRAATYLSELPAIGLKVHLGIEKYLPVLARSDHDPFWRAGHCAVMWTDTAEFRNPHYHRNTDTPDTLDYDFLRSVTQLLLACLLVGDE